LQFFPERRHTIMVVQHICYTTRLTSLIKAFSDDYCSLAATRTFSAPPSARQFSKARAPYS
jgi:hypothetical protein